MREILDIISDSLHIIQWNVHITAFNGLVVGARRLANQ